MRNCIQPKESNSKEAEDLFETVLNLHITFSLHHSLVFLFHTIEHNRQKKNLRNKTIGGQLLPLCKPFKVTPKGLLQIDRRHRRHESKFSCRMILEDELAENLIKLL